mgnify:CR=1 FL=1
MELLKSLDKNTKILNISNCGLKGVLDLREFKNLEELYCSNNEITEIQNVSKIIKYLDCSYNKLKELNTPYFLPGNYIIDLPSNFNYELKFNEIYRI